jgi:hypothetical protein
MDAADLLAWQVAIGEMDGERIFDFDDMAYRRRT